MPPSHTDPHSSRTGCRKKESCCSQVEFEGCCVLHSASQRPDAPFHSSSPSSALTSAIHCQARKLIRDSTVGNHNSLWVAINNSVLLQVCWCWHCNCFHIVPAKCVFLLPPYFQGSNTQNSSLNNSVGISPHPALCSNERKRGEEKFLSSSMKGHWNQ